MLNAVLYGLNKEHVNKKKKENERKQVARYFKELPKDFERSLSEGFTALCTLFTSLDSSLTTREFLQGNWVWAQWSNARTAPASECPALPGSPVRTDVPLVCLALWSTSSEAGLAHSLGLMCFQQLLVYDVCRPDFILLDPIHFMT